jgi:hypothetical protein
MSWQASKQDMVFEEERSMNEEIIHDSQRVETIPERIEKLIDEALSGTSARSKRTILTEAKKLVGDLK